MQIGSFQFKLSDRSDPLTVEDYRALAKRRVPRMVWAYLEHGAESEAAMHANDSAFDAWALRTRVLTGNDPQDIGVSIGGKNLSLPVLLAPTGIVGLTQYSGEPAIARAAERTQTVSIVSTSSSYTLEEIADATEEHQFLQLYPMWSAGDLESGTGTLLERAKARQYSTLFVTVDVPVPGNRLVERKQGMGLPPTLSPRRLASGAAHPQWAYRFLRHQRISARNFIDQGGISAATKSLSASLSLFNPAMNWDHLAWLRDRWDGPFYVKGILSGEDADRVIGLGADGVLVSNHGGRQLADAPSTLSVLPEVAEAVGGRGQVLLDGGIRNGADVVKALCLGADAVCIGRPYLYGMAVAGQAGVEHVVNIFREEIQRTLTLMGVGKLGDLGRDWIMRRAA